MLIRHRGTACDLTPRPSVSAGALGSCPEAFGRPRARRPSSAVTSQPPPEPTSLTYDTVKHRFWTKLLHVYIHIYISMYTHTLTHTMVARHTPQERNSIAARKKGIVETGLAAIASRAKLSPGPLAFRSDVSHGENPLKGMIQFMIDILYDGL